MFTGDGWVCCGKQNTFEVEVCKQSIFAAQISTLFLLTQKTARCDISSEICQRVIAQAMTSARVHINQLGPDTKPFVTVTSSPPFFNPGIQYPPPKSFLFLFFVHLLGNFESLSVNFLKAGFWKFMMITKFCVVAVSLFSTSVSVEAVFASSNF